MIWYKAQLTNWTNGDRFVYVEEAPTSPIPRSIKLGPHWVRVFYDGQSPDGVQTWLKIRHTSESQDEMEYSPATQENIRCIVETYNFHERDKTPSSNNGLVQHSQPEVSDNEAEVNDDHSSTLEKKKDEKEEEKSSGKPNRAECTSPLRHQKKNQKKKRMNKGAVAHANLPPLCNKTKATQEHLNEDRPQPCDTMKGKQKHLHGSKVTSILRREFYRRKLRINTSFPPNCMQSTII